MTSHFQHRNLPMLLLRARESVIQYFRPGLKIHALTEQQWRVMRVLDDRGSSDAGHIAYETCIVPPSLSGVLDRMERDGLIVRRRLAEDQRRVMVELSQDSRVIVAGMHRLIEAQYRLIEAHLGLADLGTLYTLLDRVAALQLPAIVMADPPDLTPSTVTSSTDTALCAPPGAAPMPD
jgi:homoprotocatechuate degradation regulator HpaR